MRRAGLGWLCLMLAACGGTAVRPAGGPSPPVVAAPTTIENKRALFAQAHAAVSAQRYSEAIPQLEALCPVYPDMQDYCLHDLALSRARSGDAAAADELWARLIATQPQSIFVPRAELERGRIQRARGDAAAARALLDAARNGEDADITSQALLELADLELAAGDSRTALADLMAVRTNAPGSANGRAAQRRIDELRRQDPTLMPHGAELDDEARLLLKERNFTAAQRAADEALATAPRAERAALLRLRAEAELGAGQFDQGLATLQQIVREDPASNAAAEAQFRYATLLWNRDRNAEAEQAYLELRRRYPGQAHMPEVLYALARIAQGDGRAEDAVLGYEQLADAYPDSSLAREARWRVGWIRYQQGRFREAAAMFERAGSTGDASALAEAQYWRARALERAGDRDAARHLYETIVADAPASYYAHWAEQRLGRPPTSPHAISAPALPHAIGAAPASADPYHWVRAGELQAMGLHPQARAELRAFARAYSNDPGVTEPIVQAYQAVDGYREAIRLAHEQGLTDPSIFFPLAFWPQLMRQTHGAGIDPLLVLALMRQESMFDPTAHSAADARGLMQLLPSTAEAVASRTGQPSPSGKLYDPDVNISLGVAHLQELLAGYQGDPVKTLAAYNGGEAAVARWQQRFGTLEPDEFVESITYRETRDYVKRVLGNYRRYQQEYGNR